MLMNKTVFTIITCSIFLFSYNFELSALSRPNKSSTQTIKLYIYPRCPHCHTVINFLKKKGWHDNVVIINADEEKNYQDLKRLRNDGKDYCPFLVDEVRGKNMSESRKIMDYFKEIFNDIDAL